ncbi:endonuclease/exonuclease/phosphatase family protein [Stieleria varia]|uniref:Exonuclease III n=1 Tax=Stieleria varia TaxID=2528005 RepID=A0A5C6BA03_9BACT|nr:endonuclease/exonuclease/phosphatase family protein [Stieleria varia]TWU08159.1 exonuclease III [Stieleria varia]
MLLPRLILVLWLIVPQLAAAEPEQPQRIRILSYNIHHAEGVDGKLDLERIAKVIRESQADVVALQEVDHIVHRSGSEDQPKQLAQQLGMHHVFGGNIELQGGRYGNALLSRFPITSSVNHLLPNTGGGEQRGVLQVELALPQSQRLTVLATHFDHRPDPAQRLDSAKFINTLAESISGHAVCLAGDLNAVPTSSVLEELRNHWSRSSREEHFTIPVAQPTRQIDFVMPARSSFNGDFGIRVLATKVLDEATASDHRGIWVDMELYRKVSLDEPVSRIAFGSCIKQDLDCPILETISDQHPELVLFLGDNIYGDTSDIGLLRQKYAKLGDKPEFQRLVAAARVMATWDDHDYGLNDGGNDFEIRDESQAAFMDFWQVPQQSPRRKSPGVYDASVFGPPDKRLQVIMLDTRYFRSPLKKGEKRVGGVYEPDDAADKTMLGEAQWAWLAKQLRQPAEVRLVVTSIQCIASSAGQETWANLPRERQRLFDLIKQTQAKGIVLLSGDRHWSELSRLDKSIVGYPLYELTSSSFNQNHPRGTPTENHYRADPKTYHRPNYGLIEIDWSGPSPSIRLQIRNLQSTVEIEKRLP